MGKYKKLEKRLKVEFDDPDLLRLALTHPSYGVAHKCNDNQRLEFLGDAVLQLCASDVLYRRYPKLQEGQMTRRRAALVCEASLAKAAKRLGLGEWLRLGHGEEALGGREKPSILADAMEAVIAAVYLDAGFKKASAFVSRVLEEYEAGDVDTRDAKSRLQEAMQTNGNAGPVYEIIGEEGPANARLFTARVLREDGEEIGRGQGTRKKLAEEAAAEQALKRTDLVRPKVEEPAASETKAEPHADHAPEAPKKTGTAGPARKPARKPGNSQASKQSKRNGKVPSSRPFLDSGRSRNQGRKQRRR